MFSALVKSVLATAILCAVGWFESYAKYFSSYGKQLLTSYHQSDACYQHQEKIYILFSFSTSTVNLMAVSMELR